MKRYVIDWAITTRDDLEEMATYIAEDSPINALNVVERIEAQARTLATLPMRGHIVPELHWHGVATF